MRAALDGRRDHVLQAVLLDPNAAATLSPAQIEAMVDEMLAAERDLMPGVAAVKRPRRAGMTGALRPAGRRRRQSRRRRSRRTSRARLRPGRAARRSPALSRSAARRRSWPAPRPGSACARALASVVGDDAAGRFVLDGADAPRRRHQRRHVARAEWATGLTVALTHGDDRAIVTSPGCIDELHAGHDRRRHCCEAARHVHVGSFFLQPRLAAGLRRALRGGARRRRDHLARSQLGPFRSVGRRARGRAARRRRPLRQRRRGGGRQRRRRPGRCGDGRSPRAARCR